MMEENSTCQVTIEQEYNSYVAAVTVTLDQGSTSTILQRLATSISEYVDDPIRVVTTISVRECSVRLILFFRIPSNAY